MRFSATGFKVAEVPAVTVNVAETPVLNEALTVGQQSEAIEVQAEAAILQTADSTLGRVVDSATLTNQPLATRNYTVDHGSGSWCHGWRWATRPR